MIRVGSYVRDGEVYWGDYPKFSSRDRIRRTKLLPGGLIILSADITNTNESKIMQFLKSQYSRFFRLNTIDKVIKEVIGNETTGWSVGKFFDGRYIDPVSGKIFNEKSFTVEIIGQKFDFIQKVADGLLKKFKQTAVLVKDYVKNETYLYEDEDVLEASGDIIE